MSWASSCSLTISMSRSGHSSALISRAGAALSSTCAPLCLALCAAASTVAGGISCCISRCVTPPKSAGRCSGAKRALAPLATVMLFSPFPGNGNQRQAAGRVQFAQIPQINARRRQRLTRHGGKRVAAQRSAKRHRCACPGGGHRLICALTAGRELRVLAQHRLTGPGSAAHPHQDVRVDTADDQNAHALHFTAHPLSLLNALCLVRVTLLPPRPALVGKSPLGLRGE